MEDALKIVDLLEQVKLIAQEKGFDKVFDFLNIKDNFSPSLELEYIVTADEESKLYISKILHTQFAQLMVGYNTSTEPDMVVEIEEEVEVFGVLKIVELLDFLLKNNAVYKVFAIPMKMDIMSICTSNGITIKKNLQEGVMSPTLKMPTDWKCESRFAKQRKLFLLYIIPTVEFHYPGSTRDFEFTKEKLNKLLSKEPQLNYGWNFVNEGEINSNQEIILF